MLEKIDKVFQDITGTRLNNVSQLKLFNIIKSIEENERLWNIFNAYTISDDINPSLHFDLYEVGNDEWWENISFNYYGTPFLWWSIPLMNNVVNPFEYLEVGVVLKILKSNYIYQLLKEIRNIGNL